MKRILKVVGIIVGVLVLLLVIGAVFVNARGIPSYEVKAPDLDIEYTPERIAQGERLVSMVCAECHRSKSGNILTGKKLLDIPKEFGTAYSANITKDPDKGIGQYTDGELAYMLRTGVKRNGDYTPMYMPKFPHMSDEDLYSIIAYLRSDAKPVQAAGNASVPCKPAFLTKMLSNLVWKPLPYPEEPVQAPPMTDKVAFGEYVVQGMVNCYDCHSASFTTNNPMEPTKSKGYLGGGNKMLDLEGKVILTPNITTHETGIGAYTEAEFIRAVKEGVKPDGTAMHYPMLKLTAFTDEELAAVWAYLQTVPPIDNEVVQPDTGS